MLSGRLQQKIEQYKDVYSKVKDKLKWKVSDQRTLMMLASMYVINDQPFNLKRFLDLSNYIKDEVGMFSTLKSSQRFTTAAMLDVRFDPPQKKFHEFIDLYEKLVDHGFDRGSFTYIASLVMLTNHPDSSDHQGSIERSLAIHKGMKKEHIFLTTNNDYPLAVLLAELDGEIGDLMELIEGFYDKLDANGFHKGNDLQFLSHILALDKETDKEALVERCLHLFNTFKQAGNKPKAMHYPEIGMLALLEEGTKEVEAIQQIVDQLNAEKLFKWHKDMNFIMAVNFIMSDKITDSNLIETGIYTTMEAIIQAQQAAMLAAVAGASAAASSGGGD